MSMKVCVSINAISLVVVSAIYVGVLLLIALANTWLDVILSGAVLLLLVALKLWVSVDE